MTEKKSINRRVKKADTRMNSPHPFCADDHKSKMNPPHPFPTRGKIELTSGKE
jgi:hypothetical protein